MRISLGSGYRGSDIRPGIDNRHLITECNRRLHVEGYDRSWKDPKKCKCYSCQSVKECLVSA